MTIEVVDFKGDTWHLCYTGSYRYQRRKKYGTWFYEVWLANVPWQGADYTEIIKDYPIIPVPVFTDWWEQA